MARNTYAFAVTISAGTPQATPSTTALAFPESVVGQIDLEVPPGPRGLMGFRIARSGTQVLPFTAGTWLVWDEIAKSYYFSDLPQGGGWQLVGYNTGTFAHAVLVTFHTVPLPRHSEQALTAEASHSGRQVSVTFVAEGVPRWKVVL